MRALDVHTGIAFAQVREDYHVEKVSVETVAECIGRPIRVLMIGSGGCSVLGLLGSRHIDRIDVIDASEGQLALLQAKLIAYQRCPGNVLPDLFGYTALSQTERADMFDNHLSSHLPASLTSYLEAHPQIKELGLDQCGRFEALFEELREAIKASPYAISDKAWRQAFEKAFARSHLIDVFGPEAVNYSMRQEFDTHFSRVFSEAIQKDARNLYLRKVLESPVALLEDMTAILSQRQEDILSVSRDKVENRLAFHKGIFLDHLSGAGTRTWDLIHISNITDWLPYADATALLRKVKAHLSPHGIVIARRLNGDYDLEPTMADVLATCPTVNTHLKALESAFFYDQVVAGSPSKTTLVQLRETLCVS